MTPMALSVKERASSTPHWQVDLVTNLKSRKWKDTAALCIEGKKDRIAAAV